MLLPAHLSVLKRKGLLKGRPILDQNELRGIVKRVKGRRRRRDPFLAVLLGTHGQERIGYIRNRLELVFVHNLNDEPSPWFDPERQILKEHVQVLERIDAECEQARVRKFARMRNKRRIGVHVPPHHPPLVLFVQRRGGQDDLVRIVQHRHGLVEAAGHAHPLLDKGARGHARAARHIQHPVFIDLRVLLLPLQQCNGRLRLHQSIVLEDLVVDLGVKGIVGVVHPAVRDIVGESLL